MEIKLNSKIRAQKEKLAKDIIPAVVYGPETESISIQLNKSEFDKVLSQAGESNLIDLDVEGKSYKVLVKDVQRDALKSWATHVDFYVVNMKKKVHAEVPLHFIGESRLAKEQGGMLEKNIHEVMVSCLPSDLVDHIDVDVSVLESYDDVIKMTDIKLPKNVELVSHTDDVVALMIEPKVEVEAPAPVAAPVAAAPAKGAAAPAAAPAKGDNKKA
jgi:large subunit ribosomal protein L25